MPVVFACPFVVALLALVIAGPYLAFVSFVMVSVSLWTVSLAHMPAAWEGPMDKADRKRNLQFMSLIAMGFASLCALASVVNQAVENKPLQSIPDWTKIVAWTP